MVPAQLKPADFAAYSPQARAFATGHIAILQQLPLSLLPSLLNEVIGYDWKLPAERAQIDRQIAWLGAMPPAQLAGHIKDFAALRLNPDLEAADWVNVPSSFLEQLTAWLWSTHQMDAFHAAADDYTTQLAAAVPTPQPAVPRLAIVIVGRGVDQSKRKLFSKLQTHGTYFSKVKPEGGVDAILRLAANRAEAHTEPFAHWYVDGATAMPASGMVQVSYEALAPARSALLSRTQQTITSGNSGPEALRSLLAQMKPQDVGLTGDNNSQVLNHFQLSLLTQGSGTQIFSTTFVQWAGRECLRRAQPSTLVLRYAPRQEQQPMNAMLSGVSSEDGNPMLKSDPEGSLVDADMGAYYTWLNLQRLTGSDTSRFLAWFEGHNQAVAIGPGLPRGTVSDSAIDLPGLLRLLA